jgi:hypothetical protein
VCDRSVFLADNVRPSEIAEMQDTGRATWSRFSSASRAHPAIWSGDASGQDGAGHGLCECPLGTGHSDHVLTGLLSMAGGLAVGALAMYEYRDRQSIVHAERHLFGTGRTRDWRRFWAFRRANVVFASVLFAVVSMALIANGFVYLLR